MSGKGSGRVSVADMTCCKPGQRSRFFYRIRIYTGRKGERRSMSEADYAGLVTAAHTQLHAPVILCWDNLNTHVSRVMRAMLAVHRDWLTVVQMPACAPDLNPAEGAWSQMKNSLGNLGSCGTPHPLAAIIKNRLKTHPVPARPHQRVPRPDRAHPPARTTLTRPGSALLAHPGLRLNHRQDRFSRPRR